MKYIGLALTDTGISKKTNQDSICLNIAETKQHGQVVLAMICDGMGGLSKGELASATVIKEFAKWFDIQLPIRLQHFKIHEIAREWDQLIKELNTKILEYGEQNRCTLGTTLTALLMIKDKYLIAHVGDTRVYKITSNIELVTEDQTFVAREVRRGRMTSEQAASDSRKNMLLQCVGASKNVTPEMLFGEVEQDTVYMICSDGFRHKISNQEMLQYLQVSAMYTKEQMKINGKYLINLVKERNEKDNISVVLVKSER